MLINIPSVLSPELLKVLMEMGHGDEIVIGDGNFPAQSMGKDAIVVREDGHRVNELLDAILTLMPLDQYVENPVGLMSVVPGDPIKPTIWDLYRETLMRHGENPAHIEFIDRFAFYERAKKAYCIVATSETEIYANILLKKGVVK
ncbi:MAG: L-fucose mutarotase [Lachnospiraceae bacterium]|nr:L-fucose mutarotase [Lachnospiraceae bacterium]